MIVKVGSAVLKHPMEIFIPDDEWKQLETIENKEELNSKLTKIALKQVAQYGYEIGFCNINKRRVTLNQCIECGAGRFGRIGLIGPYGKSDIPTANDNLNKWETCKKESIHYKFLPQKPLFDSKNEKFLEKMKPASREERKADAQTISIIDKPADAFEASLEKQSDEVMKEVRKQE
jgi:hypothetical protein